jgi:hypothetical protein
MDEYLDISAATEQNSFPRTKVKMEKGRKPKERHICCKALGYNTSNLPITET